MNIDAGLRKLDEIAPESRGWLKISDFRKVLEAMQTTTPELAPGYIPTQEEIDEANREPL